MATKQAADFLETLKNLTDDDFASALSTDPDLFKKAQKAIVEAKRLEAENAKRKNDLASQAAGLPFDSKLWSKAKRLVTGPFNDANAIELQTTLAKCTPNLSPEGEQSLIHISLDYLADKTRIPFQWPLALAQAGAEMGYDEIKALVQLLSRRDTIDLGTGARTFLTSSFCKSAPWAEFEAKMISEKAYKSVNNSLLEFFRHKTFGSYGGSAGAEDPITWKAMENLAKSGCLPLSTKVDPNLYGAIYSWEALAGLSAKNPDACKAKAEAFKAMIALGWCDKGFTNLTDNLVDRTNPSKTSGKSNMLENCGSRSSIVNLPLEEASLDIFHMLCQREQVIGFARYDAVGRSRLYFINEKGRRLNEIPDQHAILASMAEIAMRLGDSPESVNAQNPIAKCSSKHMADVIAAAIEKIEINNVLSEQNAAPRPPSKSL